MLATVAGVLAAIVSGACLAIQSATNAALAVPLDSGLMASFFSFMGGVASLVLIFPFTLGQIRRQKDAVSKPVRWWFWVCGGFIAAFFVTTGTFMGPKLGYGLFYASVIAGQLLMSLFVDHIAFMGLRRQPATLWRCGSMLIVLAGAMLAVADKVDVSGISVGRVVGYVILSFVGGCLLALQVPVNNAFTIRMGTLPHRTSLLGFCVGCVSVGTVWGISVGIRGDGLDNVNMDATKSWEFLGGVYGAFYLVCSVALAPVLGIAWFFVSVIAGQLLMSLLIDTFGLFSSTVIPVSVMRIVGVLLVFLGAASFRLLPLRFSQTTKPAAAVPDPQEATPPEAYEVARV
ncbi:Hypothetical Protein FCC1311_010902 [Hondaea fermentalgiana]|uniref:Uncharacterized protein n=1 Tax=Hondaea fermentalgiana TaxID=2315210 RepID=A0A2R5G1K1_9STRA|nr:Hypothetical Protein FCC1311_010902 [Hondaea fermentalgiana]|eukprot:GBG24872.1 Hypothetical Protein FCC1311_010902 [Hondaea fermentalgiana]